MDMGAAVLACGLRVRCVPRLVRNDAAYVERCDQEGKGAHGLQLWATWIRRHCGDAHGASCGCLGISSARLRCQWSGTHPHDSVYPVAH